jgi:hypothetical protein
MRSLQRSFSRDRPTDKTAQKKSAESGKIEKGLGSYAIQDDFQDPLRMAICQIFRFHILMGSKLMLK